MIYIRDETINFNNPNSPFTELMTLLKRYEIKPSNELNLAYSTDELKVMKKHLENALETLSQGLQSVGILLHATRIEDYPVNGEINHIGFFITTVSNLTEALHALQADIAHDLCKRSHKNACIDKKHDLSKSGH